MIGAATYSRWSCDSGARDPVGRLRAWSVSGRLSARLALAGLLPIVAFALASSPAAADGCSSTDDGYMSNCGPTFAVPTWTDSGGWNDPSQYSTIQLADVNGDGKDELIGRSDAGIETFRFDTTVGQWRPQIDASGVAQLLNDFASFSPSRAWEPGNPNQSQFYSTIQAADIDGRPGAEILARFFDGMRVYKYTPPAGTSSIDGGSWSRIGMRGPFSDRDGYSVPSLYSTIGVGQFKQGDPPLLFARKHSSSFEDAPVVFYSWNGAAWSKVAMPYDDEGYYFDFIDSNCSHPSCYLTLQTSNLAPEGRGATDDTAELTGRTSLGAELWDIDARGRWSFLNLDYDITPQGLPPFGDAPSPGPDYPVPDCPFSAGGATGAGSGDCLGSSPSYYETLQASDIDGVAGDELLARASDGLRVKKWVPGPSGGSWDVLPTLTALAGAASSVPDGMWGSIRTGDIDGDGKNEVLFLDGKALQAWTYDTGSKAWSQMPTSPALALAGDPWHTHPEYYATIQVGDVDGDNRDDVIARGPHGIRTWFYNRRKTGGWERYLPEGYPDFPTRTCSPDVTGPCGQQAAFDKLNERAREQNLIGQGQTSTLRDRWTVENAPDATTLPELRGDIAGMNVGNCPPANKTHDAPPTYSLCTPPAPPADGTNPFTEAEWTAVVNEMLSETFFAENVLDHIDDLKAVRQQLFITETPELTAIIGKLGLQAAANTSADFNFQSFYGGVIGIAASIAGVAAPELSAALWVGAELASTIPAASPTANSSFQTTYAGLEDQFATMVSETEKSIAVQSQQVRQDEGLLELVGQLRSRGTWAIDSIGIGSAANQAFAAWVYQALLPTVYDRYHITRCFNGFYDAFPRSSTCNAPAWGPGVLGTSGQSLAQSFTTIAQPYDWLSAVPCGEDVGPCTFNFPPSDLMNRVWGRVEPECSYTPGKAETAWTFGSCSAGVDPITSIGQNTWGFPERTGSPVPFPPNGTAFGAVAAGVTGAAARTRPRAPIRLGRPRHGHRRAVRGRARLRADTTIPRGMRLAGATVTLKRLLFEARGHGELTRPHGSRAARPLKLRLRRAAAGHFTASRTGRRSVRIALRRVGRRARTRLTLGIGAAAFRTPRTCHALPASIATDTQPLHLESRLVISHGRSRHSIALEHHVRCRRGARGNIHRLEYVHPRRHPLRPGLAVSLHAPPRVQPGTTVKYIARVHNRRRGSRRLLSSLWDITLNAYTLNGHDRTMRIRELRRGRSRRLTFTRRVPRGARGPVCAVVVATATATRAVRARACAPVRAARAPTATG